MAMILSSTNRAEAFDVVVVGAGVAGCASAIELSAAGLHVLVLDSGVHKNRIESISPFAVRWLGKRGINVGEPLDRVVAWWGADTPSFAEYPDARVTERLGLLAAMRAQALHHGSAIATIRGATALERHAQGWTVRFTDSSGVLRVATAGYLVDASGRRAVVGRFVGSERIIGEKLFALAVNVKTLPRAGVWTESARDGWWNLCSVGGQGTLSFFSRGPNIRGARSRLPELFSVTRHIKELAIPEWGCCSVTVCDSSCLSPPIGEDWIAVGEAAIAIHPLASCGVAMACSHAAILPTARKDPADYGEQSAERFRRHTLELKRQYALEARWPDSAFWTDSSSAPFSLAANKKQIQDDSALYESPL